ncbi:hypothetical protein AAC387_Pa03g0485 [Persea americana]
MDPRAASKQISPPSQPPHWPSHSDSSSSNTFQSPHLKICCAHYMQSLPPKMWHQAHKSHRIPAGHLSHHYIFHTPQSQQSMTLHFSPDFIEDLFGCGDLA